MNTTTIPVIPNPAPTLYLLCDVWASSPPLRQGVIARMTFDAAEADAWRRRISEYAPEIAAHAIGHWDSPVSIAPDPHNPATHPREVARYRRAWTALHAPTLGEHDAFAVLDEIWAHEQTGLSMAMAGCHAGDELCARGVGDYDTPRREVPIRDEERAFIACVIGCRVGDDVANW